MTDIAQSILTPSPCLDCGTMCDASTGLGRPTSGDIAMCLVCGHLMAYDSNLRLRALNDDEMLSAAGDPIILAAQAARAAVTAPDPLSQNAQVSA